ncbi:hypothetical protein DICSQDRAFT_136160 [Dichomitus squalens LYAD-421 SS1]|uniref:Uncharacterized protein n=1 Tax=Dichomitus squalens (strain LYAD-421) TaxID=732165 RepID=R7T2U2_DICSQ|nr:uncharacterized protein DICSQDRAFT_136160 [Dichomitus squalens LYAD-421 SS1]EJF62052.1 hypothetical protein DICSQDRAFT_136160 [Dichomitus squalens LYAD-421 SS1]
MYVDHADYVFQVSYYLGTLFNALLYGIELVIYIASVHMVMRRGAKPMRSQGTRFLLVFSTGLLLLTTIWGAVEASLGRRMWIANPNYSGGSAVYLAKNAPMGYKIAGSAAAVVLNLMTDGLLLYRCYVVWADVRVIILPCFLYLSTVPLGILTLFVNAVRSEPRLWLGGMQPYTLAYTSVAISSNLLVSALICARILFLARHTRAALGDEAAHMYTNAVALVVESALAYAVCGVVYVVFLAVQSPMSVMFASFYVMFTCLASQMIVLRVLMGRAWTQEAVAHSTTRIQFTTAIVVACPSFDATQNSLESRNGHSRVPIDLWTDAELASSDDHGDSIAALF